MHWMRFVNGINLFEYTVALPLILNIHVGAVARVTCVLALFLYKVEIKSDPCECHMYLSVLDQLAATMRRIQNTQIVLP